MSNFISKENEVVRIGLGLHQLVGGSIGLYLILIEPNLFFLLRLAIVFLFSFSIFAGYKYMNSNANIIYTKLNYFLQIFVFQIFDLLSFKYFLPFSFSLSIDINSFDILFNFYLNPSATIDLNYEDNSIIGINILSLLIILFLSSEKGVNKNIFDYDL